MSHAHDESITIQSHASPHSMPPPPAAVLTPSPRFPSQPPVCNQPRESTIGPTNDRRSLPPQSVTEETIDDAYATFVLYANPHYASDADTTELQRAFRALPKSDGKDFDVFALYALIRKLNAKEIKTWIQLALDLGVEPPTAENGASVQKVQQYTVRLKVGSGVCNF